MGTGDMQTQHTALLLLLLHRTNSSLPVGPTTYFTPICSWKKSKTSFCLTKLSEETVKGTPGLVALLVFAIILGHLDSLLKLLSLCLLAHKPWRKGFWKLPNVRCE